MASEPVCNSLCSLVGWEAAATLDIAFRRLAKAEHLVVGSEMRQDVQLSGSSCVNSLWCVSDFNEWI